VFISITLAAMDSDSHIHTIMALSELFQNDDDIEKIINSDSIEEIAEIMKQY
jgi:PTS system ascorbate-specific IIA component